MVFGFLNKLSINVSIDRMAEHASSIEAFNGGKATALSTSDVVEGYFQKYGSTARKFDYNPRPSFYHGYVNLPRGGEVFSVVIMQPNGSTVACFRPDAAHGQDMLGLMGKKLFAEQVVESLVKASGV